MNGLSNIQFVTICIIVMICGGAVLGHEAFEDGKNMAYDSIALAYRDKEMQENKKKKADSEDNIRNKEVMNKDEDENSEEGDDGSNTPGGSNETYNYDTVGDTSRNISSKKKKYSYAGWIKIPKMGLYKGFLANRKNNLYCVDYNICAYNWIGNSPKAENSKLLIGAHNGVNNNAFFRGIEVLKKGDLVYLEYNNVRYKYKMVEKYRSRKSKHSIKVGNETGKELYLFTCAKENHYSKNYLVMRFKLESEKNM